MGQTVTVRQTLITDITPSHGVKAKDTQFGFGKSAKRINNQTVSIQCIRVLAAEFGSPITKCTFHSSKQTLLFTYSVVRHRC